MYWLLAALAGIWIVIDGTRRGGVALGALWGVLTFLFLPVALPIYLAVRPLKTGEVREGGRAWNVLKNFAATWTVLMAVVFVGAVVGIGAVAEQVPAGLGRAGLAVRSAFGLGMLALIWLVPMIGALLLGFFLRNSTVERGPDGSDGRLAGPTAAT
jgi:hypothetical protein